MPEITPEQRAAAQNEARRALYIADGRPIDEKAEAIVSAFIAAGWAPGGEIADAAKEWLEARTEAISEIAAKGCTPERIIRLGNAEVALATAVRAALAEKERGDG